MHFMSIPRGTFQNCGLELQICTVFPSFPVAIFNNILRFILLSFGPVYIQKHLTIDSLHQAVSVIHTHTGCILVSGLLVPVGQWWPRRQGMKFPMNVAKCFEEGWRLRGCQVPEQLCLPEAAGRVGASAHFSVSEPRFFKRAPAVLITRSLGTLRHSTQHVAAHVWKYNSACGGNKKQSHSSIGFGEALVTASL